MNVKIFKEYIKIVKNFSLLIFEFGSTLEATLFILQILGENRHDGDFSVNQARDGLSEAPRKLTINKMYE